MHDEAIKIWAAKRLGVPRHKIKEVRFDSRYVEGCPTCGGTIEHEAYVMFTERVKGRLGRDIEFADFTNVINEILEIQRNEVRHA
jgi:Fe-S oxidoreductase